MTLQSTRAVELHPLCLSHPERLTLTIPLGIFDFGTTQNCSTKLNPNKFRFRLGSLIILI